MKCYMLVGVPAAGKSTWVKDNGHTSTSAVVSTDNIIDTIAFEYSTTYDAIFKDAIKLAEKLMWSQLENAMKYGMPIVVDRTNLSKKARKRFIDRLKQAGYSIDAVVFPLPEKEEWERRLAGREGKTIPKDVLESMVKNFQYPTVSEGFDSVIGHEG